MRSRVCSKSSLWLYFGLYSCVLKQLEALFWALLVWAWGLGQPAESERERAVDLESNVSRSLVVTQATMDLESSVAPSLV